MQMQPSWVAAAKAAMAATRVPASVSLAQFGLESGWGAHMPPDSLNPFGVKDFRGANAVWAMTTEVEHGVVVHVKQPFRRYPSLADAFTEHAQLLATDRRYAPAMAALPDLAAFVAHMAPVYATDPGYAGKLLAIIHGDGLARFDL